MCVGKVPGSQYSFARTCGPCPSQCMKGMEIQDVLQVPLEQSDTSLAGFELFEGPRVKHAPPPPTAPMAPAACVNPALPVAVVFGH
jgi:hypothetical protein